MFKPVLKYFKFLVHSLKHHFFNVELSFKINHHCQRIPLLYLNYIIKNNLNHNEFVYSSIKTSL